MDSGVKGHRCTACAFTFPLHYEICAICGNENLWNTYSEGPLPSWEADLTWALRNKKVEEGAAEEEPVFPQWGDLVPHQAANAAETIYLDGKLWVEHQALLDCEYLNLEADSIVFLNTRFYELQGYDRPHKRWWIEEVAIDASDLTPEQIIAYGEEA